MIIVSASILLIQLILFLISLRRSKEWLQEIDKKEHKLYVLYPMAELLLSITTLNKHLQQKKEVTDSIKALRVTSKLEQIERLYWCNKVSLVILILALFCLLSVIGEAGERDTRSLREGRYLTRPEYGEGSGEVVLDVTLEALEQPGPREEERMISRQITLDIAERVYTQEEVEKLFEEGKAYILESVLGSNESTDAIYENLSFCTSIPGTAIAVTWEPEDYNLIQSDGTVNNKELTEGISTTVTAVLSYGELHTNVCLSLLIQPRRYSDEELIDKKLSSELISSDEKTKSEQELNLPTNIDDYRLHWSEEKNPTGGNLLFLGIFLAIAMWYAKDMELKKQMKLRKEQMLIDYPEIINKFTLLVNAGMTGRQAWFKIADDYYARLLENSSPKRYAYEEMLTTAHELKLGLTESLVYEQYGRRIGLISYIKFSSLIIQNLKKGNKGFTELLKQEAMEAFEDRKEIAKRLGEEAGTKLLVPMMFMLIIVFLIILIPAFMAFHI
jgi:hypothetical protein